MCLACVESLHTVAAWLCEKSGCRSGLRTAPRLREVAELGGVSLGGDIGSKLIKYLTQNLPFKMLSSAQTGLQTVLQRF